MSHIILLDRPVKVTVIVEHEDGTTSTSVFPVAESLSMDGSPVYDNGRWPPQMRSCWYTFTLHAKKDEDGYNTYVTITDPEQ